MSNTPTTDIETFSVDTHLFRELGELLVGRDATALLELIKNSYDADATRVTVSAKDLERGTGGVITVTDNGHGMTEAEFRNGFLRIASRGKELGDKRSRIFKRRFTGAKGIGRLAAHKLARIVEVESLPTATATVSRRRKLVASIDWDLIESVSTLGDVPKDAIRVRSMPAAGAEPSGTTIRLARLRRSWTEYDRVRFVGEVAAFEPLQILTAPFDAGYLQGNPVFSRPVVRDARKNKNADQFQLHLKGEFGELGDTAQRELLAHVQWVVELSVDITAGKKSLAVIPTKHAGDAENANVLRLDLPISPSEPALRFDARILIRPGQLPKHLSSWQQRIHGVRVYMEGFRVLPYGEPGDDWLSIDHAVTERVRRPTDEDIARIARATFAQGAGSAGLSILPNKHYYGGIFLTAEGAKSLQMLVNREGFVPDASFEAIRTTLRSAIWLATLHMQTAKPKSAKVAPASTPQFDKVAREAATVASGLRKRGREAGISLGPELTNLEELLEQLRNMASAIVAEAVLLRDTAAVGLQLARFVHELNALLGAIIAIEKLVADVRKTEGLGRTARSTLKQIAELLDSLKRSFERYATYFGGLLSNSGRRRRSPQSLRERLDETLDLLSASFAAADQQIQVNVDESLRTIPMFAAELRTVFLNLLSNASKAAGRNGQISVKARRVSGGKAAQVVIENTGVRVNLADAEGWFEPFKTTSEVSDPILGQGLGLGLPIVRMIVRDHDGTIAFQAPSPEFSTAIAFSLPLRA